jgi:hypothetical protein
MIKVGPSRRNTIWQREVTVARFRKYSVDLFRSDRAVYGLADQRLARYTTNAFLAFRSPKSFQSSKAWCTNTRPDFIVRLKTGDFLVLETKGQDTDQDKTKREFLDQWVRAVNEHGGFGQWGWAVARQPGEVLELLTHTRH